MITYRVAYYEAPDGITVQVLDFPGVISCGQDIPEARMMVQSALVEMAELMLEEGKPLPKPDPQIFDEEADFAEPIHLLLSAAPRVEVVPRQIPA